MPDERMKGEYAMKIYYCGNEDCQGGDSFGPVARSHYLVHFILEGQGICRREDSAYRIKAGEAFLTYPGEMIHYEADEKKPWSYFWIAFGGEEAEALLGEYHFDEIRNAVKIRRKEKNELYLRQMLEIFNSSGCEERELLGYFYLILSCLESSENKRAKSNDKVYLEKAIVYMNENFCYDININDVARYVGIDRTYLYRIFMQSRGISPKQYIMNYRMEAARDMLRNTKYSVTEVGFSTGFRDSSSFCKCFQKEIGMSPLQYRKHKD